MLNISKSQTVIFGCSALVAASLASFAGSAHATEQFKNQNGQRGTFLIAQTTGNGSNATGTNVTTTTGGSIPATSGPGPSITTTARIAPIQQSLSVATQNSIKASEFAKSLDVPPPTTVDTSPVRYAVEKGVANVADCGCPDAEAIGSTPTTNTPSPELVAAREAEAKAAAELATAKAEARQFIESVKSEQNATSRTVDTSLW
jgi:hypothetical protein